MKTIYFKCTLLTDIVVNQKSSSVGNQQTLDFIPGNNFLGITAATLYGDNQISADVKFKLFHSGDVIYGDAHPEKNGLRSLRIPASFYYPKNESMVNTFIHHGYEREKDAEKKQLKQCRGGFYAIQNETLDKVDMKLSFAIKSAYDSEKRRSEDEKMYGYQSLPCGQVFLFELCLSDAAVEFESIIEESLLGRRRVGRSRTAQYGLVYIERADAECFKEYTIYSDGDCLVYADGRLIFLDEETGQPTFQPTAKDLGLEDGEIDWSLSQVRTFSYSPWNGKRQSFDTDRTGIEKGSVFYVKNAKGCPRSSNYIGCYTQEGFGKVIYNPDFLRFDKEQNGRSVYHVIQEKITSPMLDDAKPDSKCDSPLMQYLMQRKIQSDQDSRIYTDVNDFCRMNAGRFRHAISASQWGMIRSIAMENTSPEKIVSKIEDYISHGFAKSEWNKMQRSKKLLNFIKQKDYESYLQQVVVNLAAEMAKKSRKEEKK